MRRSHSLVSLLLLLALINPVGCVGHYTPNGKEQAADLQKGENKPKPQGEDLKKKGEPPKVVDSPLQKKGSQAPEFTLDDIQGNKVNSAQFKGKNTVIIFFVTWCGFCRKTLPLLDKLYTNYKDKNLEVVGISLDKDGAPAVKAYLEKNPLNFKVLIGNKDMAQTLGITGFPKTIMIDKGWKIRNFYPGYPGAGGYEVFEKDLLNLMDNGQLTMDNEGNKPIN